MLKDKFGRTHNYLRISLTEKCNLRCVYCMPAEGIQLRPSALFMRKEEVVSLARSFVELGVTKIRLTGGEPLVCRDAAEIIAELGKLPVELAITTNGVLVHNFIDVFKNAGLKKVNLSLDTLQETKFNAITRRNNFQQVYNNMLLLLENGFHVKVNMVVMKGETDAEIIDFVALTKDLPLHVRFIEFMPFDGNKWEWHKVISHDQILETVSNIFTVEKLQDKAHDTSRKYRIANSKGTFAVITTMSHPFCGSCNRIRLTADGKLKNCLFSNGEADLLTPLREGKDIVTLISENIQAKHFQQGGQVINADIDASAMKNRSMISIGG